MRPLVCVCVFSLHPAHIRFLGLFSSSGSLTHGFVVLDLADGFNSAAFISVQQ